MSVFMCARVDLAQQIVEAGDFLLQVFSLDDQLIADGLGLFLWVQWEDQLLKEPQTNEI